MTQLYKIKRNLPVARFFYRGQSHTHPVRREVVLVEETKEVLTGYEIRNGRTTVTDLSKAPIKSFRKENIAKYGDYQRLRRTVEQQANLGKTTLQRLPLRSVKLTRPST